jgi:putative transposase
MHSFVSCLMHVVFSTKDRRPFLTPELCNRLYPYIGGIARDSKMKALTVGGYRDHVHILVSIPSTLAVAKAVQLLKGNSSKWIHEEFPAMRSFSWQEGYGAFSIGQSGIPATVKYIDGQEEHHRSRSFRQELETILRKHGIVYEPWMLD